MTDINSALDNLLRTERSAIAVASAERRDEHVRDGNHRMAAFYSELACAAAESLDRERHVFAALDDVIDPSMPAP